jgi:MauM/NapG family ferredoxin protein
MKTARRIIQGIFLLVFLFLFLQTESKGNDELGYPVKIFLDFDPLILITTLLSAHAVERLFYLSIGIIAATVLLGRVFCGWVCPLGTLNNIMGSLRRGGNAPAGWFRVKYLILVFFLVSSIFSLQLVGILDPISLLIRSLALSIYPLFNAGINSFFDLLYGGASGGFGTEAMYTMLRKSVLAFEQPYFRQATFIGMIFLIILILNLREQRFWCRYLCPLGALLGIFSRFSLVKRSVSEGCTSCGACARVCQSNASPDQKDNWRDAECLYCWNCDDVCPQNAVSFGFGGKKQASAMDLGRRRVVLAAVSGIVTVPLIRTSAYTREPAASPLLIRPPGARPEREFLERCIKCGECMKVCITNGLQPTLLEAGLEGIWSPVLVPRQGYCEYRCTLCGQVCPTGAIRKMSLGEKNKIKIGLAMIDKGRCLPWAHATACIVCEEVCPTPKKAIWLEETKVRDRNGRNVVVQQPCVDLELCIGCGICETKCPVGSRAAIYVTSIGESRSKENQLLL